MLPHGRRAVPGEPQNGYSRAIPTCEQVGRAVPSEPHGAGVRVQGSVVQRKNGISRTLTNVRPGRASCPQRAAAWKVYPRPSARLAGDGSPYPSAHSSEPDTRLAGDGSPYPSARSSETDFAARATERDRTHTANRRRGRPVSCARDSPGRTPSFQGTRPRRAGGARKSRFAALS